MDKTRYNKAKSDAETALRQLERVEIEYFSSLDSSPEMLKLLADFSDFKDAMRVSLEKIDKKTKIVVSETAPKELLDLERNGSKSLMELKIDYCNESLLRSVAHNFGNLLSALQDESLFDPYKKLMHSMDKKQNAKDIEGLAKDVCELESIVEKMKHHLNNYETPEYMR